MTTEQAIEIAAALWSSNVKKRVGLQQQIDALRSVVQRHKTSDSELHIGSNLSNSDFQIGSLRASESLSSEQGSRGVVNRGYQRDDINILDYELWKLGDQELRGPAPDLQKPYFAVMGAAQVFGRFVENPFANILSKSIGLPALNLGMSGAGPNFFLQRPELMEAASKARFVIVQLMSGRSISNSCLVTAPNQGVLSSRLDPDERPIFAEDAYKNLLKKLSPEELSELRAENRDAYVDQMRALLEGLPVPKILLYWSKRPVDYRENLSDLSGYWGDFPHFVNKEVIDELTPFADAYIEVVTDRGIPQALFDRLTGEPVLMWPEEKFPSVRLREHNHYYPSPEMNEDVAAALLPETEKIISKPDGRRKRRSESSPKNIIIHAHIFKNAGSAIDRSLSESFGNDWTTLDPNSIDAVLTSEDIIAAIKDRPDLSAVSSHQIRFPFPELSSIKFHPIVFLRDPILRAQSIYDYERMPGRRDTSTAMHTVMANDCSFSDWIAWCLSRIVLSGPIANYQTRMCSQRHNGLNLEDWDIQVSLQNFREARDQLSRVHVGTVERLEPSMLRIERALEPYFPKLRFLSHIENASIVEGVRTERTHEALQRDLGDSLYERLCSANAYDLLLYQRFSHGADPIGRRSTKAG